MSPTSRVAPDAIAPDLIGCYSKSMERALSSVLASLAGLRRNIGCAGALAPLA